MWFRFDPKAVMAALPVGRTDIVENEAKNFPTEGGRPDSMVGREGLEPSKA